MNAEENECALQFVQASVVPRVTESTSHPLALFSVVSQSYTANVMDESVLKGNTAIFKCHIPSFVSDYVQVVSWLGDGDQEVAQYGDCPRLVGVP